MTSISFRTACDWSGPHRRDHLDSGSPAGSRALDRRAEFRGRISIFVHADSTVTDTDSHLVPETPDQAMVETFGE